jgi:deoxyribose-phosphate aldolase
MLGVSAESANASVRNGHCPVCGGGCADVCQVASLIDHTLLKPDAGRSQVLAWCAEARRYGFASICVNPIWTATVAAELRPTSILTCVVIGFPFGATPPSAKRYEAEEALKAGADELDMVINVAALKAGDTRQVESDISGVVELAHEAGAAVKVILETASLTDEEKICGCRAAIAANADFVKTSTGFGPGGATAHDVALMRSIVGDRMGVKAAGGIRDWPSFQLMVQAGATRIGASASVAILAQARQTALHPGALPPTPAPHPRTVPQW